MIKGYVRTDLSHHREALIKDGYYMNKISEQMLMKNTKPIILVIDDDEVSSMAIEGLLMGNKYDLVFEFNGLDGIERAIELHPELILLDVMMPGLDGFEVCRRIRSLPEISEVPIVMVTALVDDDDRVKGLQAGADDFINKPYNRVELTARLHAILRLAKYRRIAEEQAEFLLGYDNTIEGLIKALDLRDKETEGHTRRVTEIVIKFARLAGFTVEELRYIKQGAMLHDIGKIGIPDSILGKTDNLNEEEWKIMRMHPVYAYQWLSSTEYLLPALDIPYCHHEKWDGSGYPRGLKGEDIPLAARLFAVVDVYDAMTSNRSFRSALSDLEALKYIKDQAGKHFDPRVVEEFLKMRLRS